MKRWRVWALVAGAVLLAAVALGCGLRSGTSETPAGDQTVLRIEPFSSRVSCGSRDVSVSIYLDDLERRPSRLDASVSAGLTAFEFPLRYDPRVLQIGPPDSIVLNPGLSQEDGDRDGVVRTFLPVSNINDAEGWAVLGAASYNPTSDGSDEANAEEGLDPVAGGAPILLATVHFQSVGEGTSAVTIEPVTINPGRPAQGIDLFDPSSIEPVYKPVTVKSTSITVSGGDCSGVPRSTPLPTPKPTSTPYVEPTRNRPTPQYLTPTPAAQGGRPDCPQDWAVYRDPDGHFSACYPTDWKAITSNPGADFGTTVTLQSAGYAYLTLYWKPTSYFDGPDDDRCQAAPAWNEAEQVPFEAAGKSTIACTGYETLHSKDAPPLRSTFAEIPLGDAKGYVVLFLTRPERPDFSAEADTAASVLQSLRFRD